MTARLKVLKNSLEKKTLELDRRINNHFQTVKQANGQPLNDKRNGRATLEKWGRQSDSIRNQLAEVEKTKAAIEREQIKISDVNAHYESMPACISELIDSGKLVQWRKHPRILFVAGVEKARILYDESNRSISHRYVREIKNKDQYAAFRDVFNSLNATLKIQTMENN